MKKYREKWKKIFHTEKEHEWLNFVDVSLSIIFIVFFIFWDIVKLEEFLYQNMSELAALVCLFLIYMIVIYAIFFSTYCIDQYLIKKENHESLNQ